MTKTSDMTVLNTSSGNSAYAQLATPAGPVASFNPTQSSTQATGFSPSSFFATSLQSMNQK